VTIRLIAQRGVFRNKAPASTITGWTLRGVFGSRPESETHRRTESSHSVFGRPSRLSNGQSSRLSHGVAIAAVSELYLEDETAFAKNSLPSPLSGRKYPLFCSLFNAGALTLAKELMDSNVFVTKRKGASVALTVTTDVDKLATCDHSSKPCNQPSDVSCATSTCVVSRVVSARSARRAHVDERSRHGQVCRARPRGDADRRAHLLRVHECPAVVGPPRHACEFALMVPAAHSRTRSP
jgi:hypothetical protein